MTTILKAKSGADFLAMLPQLLGCEVSESVVFVGFNGKRTHGGVRFNLPPARASSAVVKRLATAAVGLLGRVRGVEAISVVIVTSESFGEAHEPPRAALARQLAERIERSGFRVHDALCQAADGWGSYYDPAVPPGGYSLHEIELSQVLSEVPDQDRRIIRDRSGPLRIADAPPEERARMIEELAHLRELFDGVRTSNSDEMPAVLELLSDIPAFVDGALAWDDSDRDRFGALLLCAVQGPPMRDHAMLQWASSLETGRLMHEWATAGPAGTDPSADERFGSLMIGIGPRPDADRVDRGIDLLLALVPHVTGKDRLAPLCMLAWLSWALGQGSAAGRYLDEAITIDPRYGMAEVLGAILGNGLLPDWAFND